MIGNSYSFEQLGIKESDDEGHIQIGHMFGLELEDRFFIGHLEDYGTEHVVEVSESTYRGLITDITEERYDAIIRDVPSRVNFFQDWDDTGEHVMYFQRNKAGDFVTITEDQYNILFEED